MTINRAPKVINVSALAYASANHKQESKYGERVSQSGVYIQVMSHQMSKPCETLHCSPDFHDTLLALLVLILISLPIL